MGARLMDLDKFVLKNNLISLETCNQFKLGKYEELGLSIKYMTISYKEKLFLMEINTIKQKVKNIPFAIVSNSMDRSYGIMCNMDLPFVSYEESDNSSEMDKVSKKYKISIIGETVNLLQLNRPQPNNEKYYESLLLDENFKLIATTLPYQQIHIKFESENYPGKNYSTLTHQLFSELLSRRIQNYNYWTIDIRKSMDSQIRETQINLPKKMFLESKLLQEGVCFILNKPFRATNRQWIYMWIDNNKLIITLAMDNSTLDAAHTFMMLLDNFPENITFASLLKTIENECENYFNILKEPIDTDMQRYQSFCVNSRTFEFTRRDDTIGSSAYLPLSSTVTEEAIVKDIEMENLFKDLIIISMKLLVAYSSPNLRGNLKQVNVRNNKSSNNKIKKVNYRKWVWGTNRTQYIYPKKSNNKGKKRFYCRPALAKYYITNLKEYSEYDITTEPERTYYYRNSIIKWRVGYWQGNKDKHYYAGNISGPYSKKAITWLNRISREKNIEIDHAEHNKELKISLEDNKYYLVDGYCKENNTVYEFHGDFWHGNPNIYDSNDINPKNKKTFGALYEQTLSKEKIIKSMGFNLEVIWESDFDKMVRK